MIHALNTDKFSYEEISKIIENRTMIHVPPTLKDSAAMIVKRIVADHLQKYGVTNEVSEEVQAQRTQKMIEEGKYMIRFFVNSTLADNEFVITTTNKPNPQKNGESKEGGE